MYPACSGIRDASLIASSGEACAVIITIPIQGRSSEILVNKSAPSGPCPRSKSVRTTWGSKSSRDSIAWATEATLWTSIPDATSISRTTFRVKSSSSTKRTRIVFWLTFICEAYQRASKSIQKSTGITRNFSRTYG